MDEKMHFSNRLEIILITSKIYDEWLNVEILFNLLMNDLDMTVSSEVVKMCRWHQIISGGENKS